MTLSFYETKQRLLSGVPLTLGMFGDYKAGSVHLASAGSRRLVQFFLTSEQSKVADAHEGLIDETNEKALAAHGSPSLWQDQ